MIERTAFEPEYVVPPGEILAEYLASQGMTQRDLAVRTGLTPKAVNEIIRGKAAITAQTALRLERVLGRPAHFWQNLESLYQAARVREQDKARIAADLEWLKRVPVREMIRSGWLPNVKEPEARLDAVLRFFGVSSVDRWHAVWDVGQVAYRRSGRFEPRWEALAAWLRQGELEAQRIACASYDRKRFRDALQQVRALTREPPEVFVPRLTGLCASAGVAVVFVPELPKTHVHGATRWLMPGKALIQLSLRYKSDDHLWFTFFHEAGHVLLHGKKRLFLEGNGTASNVEEHEANRFAADMLIPPGDWQRLNMKGRPSLDDVRRFADAVGIAPGIVVGRLQKEGIYDYRIGNGLKRRFAWATPE